MYGRILNEEKKFEPGDVALYEGVLCTVKHVYEQSVYYEARPISSYQTYRYRILMPTGEALYVAGDMLEVPGEEAEVQQG